MAARLTKRVTENHRRSIQVSMLINRLSNHIAGDVEMKPTQVDAAKYLISQAIGTPSKGIELSGPDGGPIQALPFQFIDASTSAPEED